MVMFDRLRAMPPRVWDIAIAVALAVGAGGEELARDVPWDPAQVASGVLRVAAAMSLVFRRQAPVVVAVFACASFAGSAAVTPGAQESLSMVIVEFVAVYSGVVHARSWPLGVAVVGVFVVAGTLVNIADYGDWIGGVTSIALYAAVVLAVAGAVRQARDHTRLEAGRADLEKELGIRRAREAVEEERARIARDIHDVVAHALSIAVLQARGGRKVLSRDTAAAEQALATIETTAEQALVEIRRLVGLLRDQPADLHPRPSLHDLTALVEGSLPPAIRAQVRVDGDLTRVTPSLDVAAYRIVQEALTNVLKHADARRVTIDVDADLDELRIEITDDGRGGAITPGNGIIGMRERAVMFGGHVETTAIPGQGCRVTANLPLAAAT